MKNWKPYLAVNIIYKKGPGNADFSKSTFLVCRATFRSCLTIPLYRLNNNHVIAMTSFATICTTAPLRAAARPQAHLYLAVRTYSGVSSSHLHSSCRSKTHSSSLTYTSKRPISSTPQNQIKDYFPPPQTLGVKEVTTAWAHPVYVSFVLDLPSCKY